mmetsp:Transcript_129403/g.307025  ORF Transcript_129403/g.307025 Transcript_129403/m.307025 type:complete len:206 (+) Transcript_129403:504-1121(+)|eukprot:CAMPEP_0181417144 /NCGR_PEP_ID=MMETSP1110-20121109/10889_1 /TAXON_ID=174948 /ORGANISM="Symbiodinium sp., Strain CCMP421" /LENGTH=205 /DNA_ID=CAMNT_0023540085 /DNA_START=398 /DNA_END=1015 /DNA_ORIENTATION=-
MPSLAMEAPQVLLPAEADVFLEELACVRLQILQTRMAHLALALNRWWNPASLAPLCLVIAMALAMRQGVPQIFAKGKQSAADQCPPTGRSAGRRTFASPGLEELCRQALEFGELALLAAAASASPQPLAAAVLVASAPVVGSAGLRGFASVEGLTSAEPQVAAAGRQYLQRPFVSEVSLLALRIQIEHHWFGPFVPRADHENRSA